MSEDTGFSNMSNPSLLLVEDNPLHVRLVRTMIHDMWPGFENLEHVARLDHAIQSVKADRPDCVLLDLVLPDADGLEAVDAVVRVDPTLPIVVLSAHDDELMAADAIRKGAQDYLVKGHVTAERLSRAVRFAIERNRGASTTPSVSPSSETAQATAVLDVSGSVIVADPGLASMLGRELDDIVGASLDSLVHEDDLAAWRKGLEQGVTGTPVTIIARMAHSHRSEVRCRIVLSALADGSGEVAAFIARYQRVAIVAADAQKSAMTVSV